MSPDRANPAATFSLNYADFLRFRDLILEHSGLYFSDKKQIDLELGLAKALPKSSILPENGVYNLNDYFRRLTQPEGCRDLDQLVNVLTVGETYFFRDEAQFNALTNHVLPLLIQQKRAAAAGLGIRPQLRIWSAGCASGEEPYSVAILLKELLPDIANWYILILATDINHDALARAKKAVYSEWSFREARAKQLRPRYFTETTHSVTRYQLAGDIRSMVTFAPLNLIADPYPVIDNNTVSMDLILCRNVTIYFTEATTRQVIKQFYHTLVDGGWLAVGHSEPSLLVYRDFKAQTFSNTLLYQKTRQYVPWPAVWPFAETPAPTPMPVPTPAPRLVVPPVAAPAPEKPVPLSAAEALAQARLQLENGQIEQAAAGLRQLLAEQPNEPVAHSLMGRAFANQGNWPEARHYCRRALELDRLQVEAYRVLALVHENEGDLQPAIEMLKKAIYLDRGAPLDHFNLAVLYLRSAQADQARRAVQNTIKILERWSPEVIVPGADGITVKYLLDAAQNMRQKL